jgi:5S rRNA maturation endonuclease (ribonuclease M5)
MPEKPSGNGSGKLDIVAEYDYSDEKGKLLYQVCRLSPKSFRQRRPQGEGWTWKLGDVPRVLYRLREVLDQADRGGVVYVVEGEKDVAAVEQAGGVATCNSGGAGKWRDEYSQALKGAQVIVVADNDDPGRKHAAQVAASLKNVAASVSIVKAAVGKDAADHLGAGKTLAELVGEDVVPDTFYIDWATFCAADHDEAEWDYPDVLARGRGHALYAPAGQGKSLFSLWMAVEMTRLHPDLHVHYFDYEMTEADLHERLDSMGVLDPLALERLHYALLPDLPPLDTAQGAVAMMERIDVVRAAHPAARHATVIDTMGRAVAGEENDADTYRDFSRLTGMALRRRCITWVRCDHAGKDPSKMQRGSSAKNDDVDVVWLLMPTNGGITLKRDKARMGWVSERIVFAQIDEPLRYERRTDDWPEGTGALANLLDRLAVPLDATSKVCAQRLRDVREPHRKQDILAALRYRHVRNSSLGNRDGNRPEPSDCGSGNQPTQTDEFPF